MQYITKGIVSKGLVIQGDLGIAYPRSLGETVTIYGGAKFANAPNTLNNPDIYQSVTAVDNIAAYKHNKKWR